ncbi:MAG: glycosyltransferase family 4 protein, partial [bacterium]
MLKILVFTTLYPNNIWPNQNVFVKERMTAFAKLNGCEVKVVAPVPYFPPIKISSKWQFSQVKKHEIIEGVEVYHPRYFMIPKIGMALHGLLMFLSVVVFVAKIQRTYDFDLIDCHYIFPDGFAAVLLGKVLGKPVVVSARGTDINLFPK